MDNWGRIGTAEAVLSVVGCNVWRNETESKQSRKKERKQDEQRMAMTGRWEDGKEEK